MVSKWRSLIATTKAIAFSMTSLTAPHKMLTQIHAIASANDPRCSGDQTERSIKLSPDRSTQRVKFNSNRSG